MYATATFEIDYPAPPRDEQEAIQQGLDRRTRSDKNSWEEGWHAQLVTEQFGSAFFAEYAAAIRRPLTTLSRIRWAASKYTPEIVNRFPGLPFSMFETVASLMDDDPELALMLLSNAFDTPGITCEQFTALCFPGKDLKTPPFQSQGVFGQFPQADGTLIIGIRIANEVETWQRKAKDSPLYGEFARLSINVIPI